jgi:uncharacterized protein YjbI with pentapeptide repeats
MFYLLARATLRGAPFEPFVLTQAWKDGSIYKRIAGVSGACVLGVILYLISAEAIKGVSRSCGILSLRGLVTCGLEEIGFRPFADIGRQEVSTKPSSWTGDVKEYPLVKGARLPHANLQYANAYLAFLVNADMRGCKLSNAILPYANLSNADLSNADLSNADLSGANLSGANLSKAKLSGAKLSGATLSDANLSNADLSDAELSNAYLSKANLSKAELSGAKLSYATLSNAKLDEAYLQGIDLRDTEGLTESQLKKAKTDKRTLLPANLPP